MPALIEFSDAAAAYLKNKISSEGRLGFRLSIKKTGCSGYSYVPTLIDTINTNDRCFTLDNGINIYVDAAWLNELQGVQVDYVEENKLGLKQKRLVFVNPNESARCGCGESFHIE